MHVDWNLLLCTFILHNCHTNTISNQSHLYPVTINFNRMYRHHDIGFGMEHIYLYFVINFNWMYRHRDISFCMGHIYLCFCNKTQGMPDMWISCSRPKLALIMKPETTSVKSHTHRWKSRHNNTDSSALSCMFISNNECRSGF